MPKPTAFISYAHAEPLVAHDLARRLSAAGVDVFFDKDALRPGKELNEEIKAALDAADVVYFVATPTWAERPWCRAEAAYVEARVAEEGKPRVVVIRGPHPRDKDAYPPSFAPPNSGLVDVGEGAAYPAPASVTSAAPPWVQGGLKPRLHLIIDPSAERLGRKELEDILPNGITLDATAEARLERIADLCFEVSSPEKPDQKTTWQQGVWVGPRHILTCAETPFSFLPKSWSSDGQDTLRSTVEVWAKDGLRLLQLDEPRRGLFEVGRYESFSALLAMGKLGSFGDGAHVVDVGFKTCPATLQAGPVVRCTEARKLERGAPVFDENGGLMALVCEADSSAKSDWEVLPVESVCCPAFDRALAYGSWHAARQILSVRVGEQPVEALRSLFETEMEMALEDAVSSEEDFGRVLDALHDVLLDAPNADGLAPDHVKEAGRWIVMLHAAWDSLVEDAKRAGEGGIAELRAAILDCYAEMVMARLDGRPIELEMNAQSEWVGRSAWAEPIASASDMGKLKQVLSASQERCVLKHAVAGFRARRIQEVGEARSELHGIPNSDDPIKEAAAVNAMLEERRQRFIKRRRKRRPGDAPIYLSLGSGSASRDEMMRLASVLKTYLPALPILLRGSDSPRALRNPKHLRDVLGVLFPRSDKTS